MNSREGNIIPALNCGLRESIKGNSETICAHCEHVLDSCKSIRKERKLVFGYIQINSCNGFKQVQS